MLKRSFLESFRAPIKYTVLLMILTAAYTALCFAINYNIYVQKNISDIDKAFTTIAVPNTQFINNYLPDPYQEKIDYTSNQYTAEADFYLALRNFVETSKSCKLVNSEILRGICHNVTPVLSGAFNTLEYSFDADNPNNSAAFIVTVEGIEYKPSMIFDLGLLNSGGGTGDSAHYIIKFRVDEKIILNSCYEIPEIIYATSGAFTADLRCPYENGKQYFISGIYKRNSVIQKERNNGTPFSDTYLELDENSVPSIYLDGSNFSPFTDIIISNKEAPVIKDMVINGESTTAYTYSDNELSKMCIVYDGNLKNLIKERPDIAQRIDSAKANSNSIEILTTENLYSILSFNQLKANILVGRNFTKQEITSGAPVCVVSERFASLNDLKIGDSFPVSLYNPVMRKKTSSVWEMTPFHDPINPFLHDKETPRGNLKLEIIGIYNTSDWGSSAYSLKYNTVIIPSTAVPVKIDIILPEKTENLEEQERYFFSAHSPHMIPALFSVMIPNAKLDAYKDEAKDAGYNDFFIYNDQGYSQIKDILPMIEKSTRLFMITSIVGFIAVFVLYLSLIPSKRQELGMLLSIGAKRSEAVMSIIIGWLMTIIPALILCFIVVIFTSQPLANIALNLTLDQLQYNDAFSIGTQENVVNLSSKFGNWTNDYSSILFVIIGMFILYFLTALIFYMWQSKQSVLKLLRRNE